MTKTRANVPVRGAPGHVKAHRALSALSPRDHWAGWRGQVAGAPGAKGKGGGGTGMGTACSRSDKAQSQRCITGVDTGF